MANATDYLEVELRKHLFRTGSFTKPTVLAVALCTTAPTDAAAGTEVTGGAYTRMDVPPLDANWTAVSATDGLTDNAAVITFPTATAAWGTVTHFEIYDALTAGNRLFWGALAASKVVASGDVFRFPANSLDIVFA